MRHLLIVALVAAGCATGTPAPEPSTPKAPPALTIPFTSAAVLPLKAKGGADQQVLDVLDDLLLSAFQNIAGEKLRVVGKSDIEAMLDLERTKDAVGCDEVACAVEIAGALGVESIISATAGKLGSKYMLTLAWFDQREGRAFRRHSQPLGDSAETFDVAIQAAVASLCGAPLPEPTPAAVAQARRTAPEPEPAAAPSWQPEPEPEPEPEPTVAPDAQPSWRMSVPGAAPPRVLWRFANDGHSICPPAADLQGNLYLWRQTPSSSVLFSLAPDGRQRWAREWLDADEERLTGCVVALGAGGMVLTGDRRILAALRSDGSDLWRHEFEGDAWSNREIAVGAGGNVYVNSWGDLAAVDRDGKLLWEGDFGTNWPIASELYGPTFASNGTIFASGPCNYNTADPCIVGFGPDGVERWRHVIDTGSFPPEHKRFSAPALGLDGRLYATFSEEIHVLDPDTGSVIRTAPLPGDKKITLTAVGMDGTLYIVQEGKRLRAFSPEGTPQWEFNAETKLLGDVLIAGDDTVLVADTSSVTSLGSDGTPRWTMLPDPGWLEAAGGEIKALSLTRDGRLLVTHAAGLTVVDIGTRCAPHTAWAMALRSGRGAGLEPTGRPVPCR